MKENLEKKDVIECLESFGYFEYFNQQVLDGKSPYFDGKEIYLGYRKGYLFEENSVSRGVLDAANRYLDLYPMASNLLKGRERIEYWRKTFESLNDEKELLVATIDILDWGNVWSSNLAEVIEIYRGRNSDIQSLISYFKSISEYVKEPKLIGEKDKIKVHFSSGWTKVYSFMYDSMVIYDSRVSAFLNYTLLMALKSYCEENSSDGEKRKKAYEGFHNISSNLFNFSGSGNTGNLRKFSFKRRSSIFKTESNISGSSAAFLK